MLLTSQWRGRRELYRKTEEEREHSAKKLRSCEVALKRDARDQRKDAQLELRVNRFDPTDRRTCSRAASADRSETSREMHRHSRCVTGRQTASALNAARQVRGPPHSVMEDRASRETW